MGVADVDCECELDQNEVSCAVQNAGYALGKDGKFSFISKNRKDYLDLGIAFFITVALFFVAKTLGIFDISKSITGSNYSSLPVVFLIGLTAGVSTCMALVGGLVLGAAARFSVKNPRATGMEKFTPHLYFNIGRIISYFVLGGALGFLGSIFQFSTSVLGMLTVIAGFVMLLLGSQLIDVFPFLKRASFTLPKGISRALGITDTVGFEYSNTNVALMGASTFFLPCGFTQAMQLFAMSFGSPLTGALTMGVFALGTAPGLLGIGGLTSAVRGNGAKLFFKTAGVVVILLSFFNITNGLNLLGVTPEVLGIFTTKIAVGNTVSDPNVTMVDGIQEVRMTQESGGYRPNKFTIKKGVPVKWIITSNNIYTCAASIVSQQLNIKKSLQLGENVFEFTPNQAGTIRFSCSMGMFTGSFTVVDESASTGSQALQEQISANTKNRLSSVGVSSCSVDSGGCGGCGARKYLRK
jgi:sulfite exporter TauE/SafE